MLASKIIEEYNFPVPRYTSYPTAPNFIEVERADNYYAQLAGLDVNRAISLYLHIPFCPELCWYCGCNTQITKREDLIEKYVYAICQELNLIAQKIDSKLPVDHIHFGGGTPNSISTELFEKIMKTIHRNFDIKAGAEIATELDPRTLSDEMIIALAKNGINRVSFGVQDFDAEVQKAIHRVQPYDLVAEKMQKIKDAGIDNVNFDLIYGLPLQNIDKMQETIAKVEKLSPSRLSVFAYAHVPWMKSHQKMIAKNPVPSPEERLKLMLFINNSLQDIGYEMIGIDHFARPEDEMAIAYKEKTLHRNFQGYTTDTAQNLIGIGASSISKLDAGYFQNFTKISDYQNKLMKADLPIAKQIIMKGEDNIRANIIKEVMCYFEAEIPENIMQQEQEKLRKYEADGIVNINGNKIEIVQKEYAPIFARIISACFDEYFSIAEEKHAKSV